ncbi:hypothetical protein QYF61_005512 [Mycteria americana]|uniref:Uncharacterized protein n=1 Tax=Mycteria americana TaxID=33587 RepID=A0AAN7N4B0_MYCAM|nr:hypothetical protein QYF61_005512 [Mycteria americana]
MPLLSRQHDCIDLNLITEYPERGLAHRQTRDGVLITTNYIKFEEERCQRAKDVMLLLRSALLGAHPERCAQVWAPQYNRQMGILERAQQRTTEMTEGLEHLT